MKMRIIKEWYGKSGLIARFYQLPEGYFLDYKGCHITTRVFVCGTKVTCERDDVPNRYIDAIQNMARKGIL